MPAHRIDESVRVLPHSHDGVYGEPYSGFNARVRLDWDDFVALGKPDQIEVVVRPVA